MSAEQRVPRNGDLRVWHVPQVPCVAFRVDVKDADEAVVLLDVLADYDAFQLEHHIKPDYCNAGGIEVYEDGEWCDFDFDSASPTPGSQSEQQEGS